MGNAKAAEASRYESMAAAADAKDDRLLAKAWVDLFFLVGYKQARYEEGLAGLRAIPLTWQ